ncbi:MAG: hypothetical protein SFV24_19230 [Gemmatimonadales bacterium]|nr:hypothetical protein [Gemmatimonadales bacterium]
MADDSIGLADTTVEQARERVCPFTLGRSGGAAHTCFGAQCMAWRWREGPWLTKSLSRRWDGESEKYNLPHVHLSRYLAKGWELYTPDWVTREKESHPNWEAIYDHLRIRNPNPLGYCGLAEPRVAEVEPA